MVGLAARAPDDRTIRLAQAGRRGNQVVEHGLQVERGTRNDAQHFGGRGFPLQRGVELAGAQLELFLQVGLGGSARGFARCAARGHGFTRTRGSGVRFPRSHEVLRCRSLDLMQSIR